MYTHPYTGTDIYFAKTREMSLLYNGYDYIVKWIIITCIHVMLFEITGVFILIMVYSD